MRGSFGNVRFQCSTNAEILIHRLVSCVGFGADATFNSQLTELLTKEGWVAPLCMSTILHCSPSLEDSEEFLKPKEICRPPHPPHEDQNQTSSTPTKTLKTNLAHRMCNFWLVESPCGHRRLMAGSNCYRVYEQLQRINDPAEFHRPGVPFRIPPECLPNRRNVQRTYTNEYCSYECRNNGHHGERCGMRDARYGPGSERIGVGWRY
ncbi:hypothetical protein BDZ45DRAFT_805610 [Acephala macrosclerotiorum]|nr:hypothetical protein BDZ45DRAFT_805610 [Acephala macrosclerotiorum]